MRKERKSGGHWVAIRDSKLILPVFVQDPILARQQPFTGPTWIEKYGPQIDSTFSGPLSFSHLPYTRCLDNATPNMTLRFLAYPRFGPFAIRSGSRRQRDARGYTLSWAHDPFAAGQTIIDCGDVSPSKPFDNALAIDQMEVAYSTLLARSAARDAELAPVTSLFSKDGLEHPRIISLGGDHTIVLPILRSLNKVYGPISVIHFDAHLDTWPAYPGQTTDQSRITHGTFFYIAQEEGLLGNNSIHGGIRCKLAGTSDLDNDAEVGFQVISTDDIDDLGIPTIIRKIRQRIGDSPVYLSLDIDVIDPGLAPATGTPEAGGWTTRELNELSVVLLDSTFGADIVEVAPAYDNAEITGIAAADFVHDFLSMLTTKAPPTKPGHH
ncbi:Arginase/deacetylase [Pholiota molesta]|nr:Arginase/deacetylase [Pholiota molesta]